MTGANPDGIIFDDFADAPELLHAKQALAAGDLATFRAMYDAQDWRGRSLLTGVAITEEPHLEPMLADFARQFPGDPMIDALRAWHLVKLGWKVRTGKLARYVSKEQFAAFREYLCRAEQIFMDLTARFPDHVSAWECRIVTAKGLSLGVPEARRRYAHAMRTGTHSYAAQCQLLDNLAPKWGGSWDAYFAHARECLASAPVGTHHATLVVLAHLTYLDDMPDLKFTDYFRRPEVQADVREAARKSVWHPQYRDPQWQWVETRNLFAFAFFLMGDLPAAAAQFAAMGRFGQQWHCDELKKRGCKTGADVFLFSRAQALAAVGLR